MVRILLRNQVGSETERVRRERRIRKKSFLQIKIWPCNTVPVLNREIFWNFSMYVSKHCFICRPSDSTVYEDVGIEPKTVAASALAVRRSSHSATSLQHSATSHPQLGYISSLWYSINHPVCCRDPAYMQYGTHSCGPCGSGINYRIRI